MAAAQPAEDEWDPDAHAARFAAELDAGQIAIPAHDEQRQGAWFSLAETDDPALLDPAAFTQGGPADELAPDAVLAALAQAACDPAVLAAVTDNALLGLVGGSRRLAGRAAAIQQATVAEYARRHAEPDRKRASRLGFTPFAADDLAPELMVTTTTAEVTMSQSLQVERRLPQTTAAQWDGQVTDYRVKIIAEATMYLTDEGAAEADAILAQAAPGLTPGQLRAMAARVVMMIDPQAVEDRRKRAAQNARVEKYREYDGTAALCGRDLPPDAVLASWRHIDTAARALRKHGAAGTLQQLRAAVYLGLTAGMDPLAMLARIMTAAGQAPAPGTGAGDAEDAAGPQTGTTGTDDRTWPWDEPNEAEAWHDTDQDDSGNDHQDNPGQDGEDGEDGEDGGTRRNDPHPRGPTGPRGGAAPSPEPGQDDAAGVGAPFPALINLLIPVGNPYGWSSAPGEIPGFGPLDPRTTQDLMQAASRHRATRWCITLIGGDGTAVGHGCAPGQHPWTPPSRADDPNRYRTGGGERDGPGYPRDGGIPDPGSAAKQQAAAAEFLSRLQVKPAPIAKGDCDHADYTDKYVVPRGLKHLIKARRATCVAPGCNRPAVDGDADHTVPWPEGPTCQHNLGGLCRYHHRNKQAPGWKLEQTQPGVFEWHAPSGRTRTTRPARYLI
jgi:Domain of unknown function (DUF222)